MRFPLVGLLFLMLISCGEKVPAGIIPEKQMPGLLLDVHLADGQLAAMPVDSARMYLDSYYTAIFNHYKVDSAMFVRSIAYYSRRPRIMNEFYTKVEQQLETINATEQRSVNAAYQTRRAADSIARLQRSDSLRRMQRDSLDYARKKQLLLLHSTDSTTYSEPVPVTYERLTDRLWERLGLRHPELVGDTTLAPETPDRTPAVQTLPPVINTHPIRSRQ